MSVKKHYQKRNQELNKDLMKRWGYTPSKEPIDEGLFDDTIGAIAKATRGGSLGAAQNKLDAMPGGNLDVSKYLSTDFDAGANNDDDSAEEKADDVIDSLEDKEKKLTAFANQTLALLAASGIPQEDKIYKDIVKSMKDAVDSLKVTGTEVSSAIDSPQSDEQNQNYKENIAKIEKSQYGERISTFNKDIEPKLANLDNKQLMTFFQANLLRPMESMAMDNDLDPGMVVSDARGPAGERMKISTAVENLKNLFKKLAQAGAMKDQKEIYNHLQAVPNIGKLGLRNSAKKITDALIQNLPSGLELDPQPGQPGHVTKPIEGDDPKQKKAPETRKQGRQLRKAAKVAAADKKLSRAAREREAAASGQRMGESNQDALSEAFSIRHTKLNNKLMKKWIKTITNIRRNKQWLVENKKRKDL